MIIIAIVNKSCISPIATWLSSKNGGSGLGLSIVKHGAIYHGAKLELESLPGHGTTVTVVFPKATFET